MTEVIIDGIKYVPSEDVKSQIETMGKVLKSVEYLSDKAIEEIISKFEEFSDEDEKPRKFVQTELKSKGIAPSSWANRIFQFDNASKKRYRIDWIFPDGRVRLKSGYIAKWKIQDAFKVNEKYHKGFTYSEFKELVNELKPSKITISRILYSLLYGDLREWMEKWKRMNTPEIHPQKNRPVQNNPQKRKEMGYGVVM